MLCITTLLNNRNQCALISYAFFLLIVCSFTVSASILSRGRATEATASNVGVFSFTQPASTVFIYANPLSMPAPSVSLPITTGAWKCELSLLLIIPLQAEWGGCSLEPVAVLCIAQKSLRVSTSRGKHVPPSPGQFLMFLRKSAGILGSDQDTLSPSQDAIGHCLLFLLFLPSCMQEPSEWRRTFSFSSPPISHSGSDYHPTPPVPS